eukprot:scaffold2974_cov181-Amphora_coffeaeformis.AAC.29
MSPVLKTASVEAILEAMDKSLATKMAMVKVLQTAKRRQMMALANDRVTWSPPAPACLPAWDLFIRRSPINMVNALEKKSAPTTCSAAWTDPENLKVVANVTDPAMTLHNNDLTMLRVVVSVKVGTTSFFFFFCKSNFFSSLSAFKEAR